MALPRASTGSSLAVASATDAPTITERPLHVVTRHEEKVNSQLSSPDPSACAEGMRRTGAGDARGADRTRVVRARGLSLGALCWSLVACGGSVSPGSVDAGADSIAPGDAPATDAPLPHPPTTHRPTAESCATPPLPPEPDLTRHVFGPSATFDCKVHADCKARSNGRCVVFDTSPPTERGGTRCVYSSCNVDADCAAGSACECGSVANACLAGNCRVDADCKSGYCSPSFDPCSGAKTGYWCHGPTDECIDNSDCDAAHFKTHCEADPATARWTCPGVGCGA